MFSKIANWLRRFRMFYESGALRRGGAGFASEGGGGFTASGGVAFGSGGTKYDGSITRPRSGRLPLRERSDRLPLKLRSGWHPLSRRRLPLHLVRCRNPQQRQTVSQRATRGRGQRQAGGARRLR